MDDRVVNDVQSTWKIVESMAPEAAALFYRNLFEADPALQPLFKGEMEEQGKKLMQMIGAAVDKLSDIDSLVPILQSLAIRHKGYGVNTAHYETVGGALMKTLEQGLGPSFTPQVRDSWSEVYGLMSSVMVAAAET
jgi:methyl-accepting chemotaxis protein